MKIDHSGIILRFLESINLGTFLYQCSHSWIINNVKICNNIRENSFLTRFFNQGAMVYVYALIYYLCINPSMICLHIWREFKLNHLWFGITLWMVIFLLLIQDQIFWYVLIILRMCFWICNKRDLGWSLWRILLLFDFWFA